MSLFGADFCTLRSFRVCYKCIDHIPLKLKPGKANYQYKITTQENIYVKRIKKTTGT
jgi:hypothetical protein